MGILLTILLAIHLISVAAIVGGWFAHFTNPTVTTSQWWGAIGMIVTGLAMAAMVSIPAVRDALGWGGSANHLWLGVKALIGIAVFVAALIGRRKVNRGELVPTGLAHAVGGLGLVNILVAVLWQ
ncbi:membrane protein [Micrococcus luteus]|nr:membrane protein [Micrococcus luteus]